MNIFFGPILKRADGYEYDTWSPGHGVAPSYSYRRLEDARYARRIAIMTVNRGVGLSAIGCNTVAEFIENWNLGSRNVDTRTESLNAIAA